MKVTTSLLTTLKPFNLSKHMNKVKLLHYKNKIKRLRKNKITSPNNNRDDIININNEDTTTNFKHDGGTFQDHSYDHYENVDNNYEYDDVDEEEEGDGDEEEEGDGDDEDEDEDDEDEDDEDDDDYIDDDNKDDDDNAHDESDNDESAHDESDDDDNDDDDDDDVSINLLRHYNHNDDIINNLKSTSISATGHNNDDYDNADNSDQSNIVSPNSKNHKNNTLVLNIMKNELEVSEYYIKQQIVEVMKYGKSKFVLKKNTNVISPTKTRTRAPNLIITINEDIEKQLKNAKQLNYACKSIQNKEAFIKQNLQLLSWILDYHYTKRSSNLLQLIKYIVDHTKLLDDWYNFLHDEKKMSHDTIRGRFNNISVLIQLFNSSLVNKKDNSVEKCIEYCRIITRKCDYDIIDAQSNISTEDYMDKGLLPRNLKSDLLKMWEILLPLINNIIQLSKNVTLRKKYYCLLLKCILFGFWAENSNGRMRAVVSMTLDQYKQMCKKNYNSSSKTKSIKQHGRQLVSLCSNSELLVYLKLYVNLVRPQIKCNKSNKEYVFLK